MPSHAPIVAASYTMHLILGGIKRAAAFFDKEDRAFFLEILGVVAAEQSVAVHAYVLMINHVHLLMTAARDNGVAAVTKRVEQRRAQHVNRTYQRTVGLFEGEFCAQFAAAYPCLVVC
jgi:putative transposase